MLQGHTTAIVPCGNPTPKKLPTGAGEWPTFRTARTARAQRTVRPPTKFHSFGTYMSTPLEDHIMGMCLDFAINVECRFDYMDMLDPEKPESVDWNGVGTSYCKPPQSEWLQKATCGFATHRLCQNRT